MKIINNYCAKMEWKRNNIVVILTSSKAILQKQVYQLDEELLVVEEQACHVYIFSF